MSEEILLAGAVALPFIILIFLLAIGTALVIAGIFKAFEKPSGRPRAR